MHSAAAAVVRWECSEAEWGGRYVCAQGGESQQESVENVFTSSSLFSAKSLRSLSGSSSSARNPAVCGMHARVRVWV
jgi:hypothetical protein